MKKSRSFGSPAFDSSITKGSQQGTELLLSPVELVMSVHGCCSGDLGNPISMSQRFTSFGSGDRSGDRSGEGSRRSSRQKEATRLLGDVIVPVSDIMVVDMYGNGESHRTNITTMSFGFFEFTLESRNGQEVLLAFLKASLPKERVMEGSIPRSPSSFSQHTASTGSKSFDVEAFTASRMAERMSNESFSEKLRRKVGRVVSSFEESKFVDSKRRFYWFYHGWFTDFCYLFLLLLLVALLVSTAITECACGCSKDTAVSPAPLHTEKRDSPPRNLQYEYDMVETAPHATPEGKLAGYARYNNATAESTKQQQDMLKHCNLPSGLSVEHDPEMESTGY
jgi:hypothetical protein